MNVLPVALTVVEVLLPIAGQACDTPPCEPDPTPPAWDTTTYLGEEGIAQAQEGQASMQLQSAPDMPATPDDPESLSTLQDDGIILEQENEFSIEFEFNSVYEADNKDNISTEFLVVAPWKHETTFAHNIKIRSELAFVPEGEDNVYREYDRDYQTEGFYVEELKLSYSGERILLSLGKYDPRQDIFGLAPIYFGNYSTDLNLEDRLAVGLAHSITIDGSRHRFAIDCFTLDTTILSKELTTGDGGHEPGDSEVGNSGDMNNFLFTLHHRPVEGVSGAGYTIGSARQRNHDRRGADESSLLGSVLGLQVLPSQAEVLLSIDILNMRNRGGQPEDSIATTAGLGYSDWPFFLGITLSHRTIQSQLTGEPPRYDDIVELVWRQGLGKYFSLEAGFQWVNEGGEEQKAVGAVLARRL